MIESINGDLDNFLAMYEDESDEEEEAKPVDTAKPEQVESLVPEFVCALCKSGPSKDLFMYPCLICHLDDNAALRTRANEE